MSLRCLQVTRQSWHRILKPSVSCDLHQCFISFSITALAICTFALTSSEAKGNGPKHIVLVMADDLGNAEVGYRNHPAIKTPNIDALAAGGIRLDRFYSGGPTCSPTRASVLTGRTHERTGVLQHGYPLRLQEGTLADEFKRLGYATAHFGKWHLNGLRGPGVPVLGNDLRHPGKFGFDHWLAVTNYFDMNPLMSEMGTWKDYEGDSSEVIVDAYLTWLERQPKEKPTFALIWYGSPHSPFLADDFDTEGMKDFPDIDKQSLKHHGEIVAMDRSIGALMSGLEKLGSTGDTLVWFTSDNGGLPRMIPNSTEGLRGHKGSLYEGGIRVPCVVHWPSGIEPGSISDFPAGAVDIAPTLIDLADSEPQALVTPTDGISLKGVLNNPDQIKRPLPLGFSFGNGAALIDNDLKIIRSKNDRFELYDLAKDPVESSSLMNSETAPIDRMRNNLIEFEKSVERSLAGDDIGVPIDENVDPKPQFWRERPEYVSERFKRLDRPEYKGWFESKPKKKSKAAKR
ncbi:MAG: sulfatase-like hydrolase/transferase [Planctomycetota bacterium]